MVIDMGYLKRLCKYIQPDSSFQFICNHPQNEWDGLCGIESCERCRLLRLLFFGKSIT